MVESHIKTYTYDNGEIQRVQAVTMDSFSQLHFFRPQGDERAFGKIVNLYRNFIVPKAPWVFGRMVLVYCPDLSVSACELLRKYVRVDARARLKYGNARVREFCEKLISQGRLEIVCGKLPHTKILPVGATLGFLSENLPEAQVKVNSNFFIMDCFDVASPADRIGAPIGLMLEDGKILNPPAYGREALLVDDEGKVEIRPLELRELTFEINGVEYAEAKENAKENVKENAKIYERPTDCHVYRWQTSGRFVVIVGCTVVAVYEHGGFEVPSSGFVLRVDEKPARAASDRSAERDAARTIQVGDTVTYKGLEHVKFGVQVGNSVIVNGEKTTGFKSAFYSIYKRFGARAYPPSLYPLDYDRARAPRIALGALADGRPCILWAEGPKKTGYVAGEQSRGASLREMAEIAEDLGLRNAVNLDGGGSAEILLFDGRRELEVSDRNPEDDSGEERGVPVGIYLKNI